MTPQRGEVGWVSLDPTQGAEIQKTRPCLILTANMLNRLRQTVVVGPFSTATQAHPPITVAVICQGKAAVAVVDQVLGSRQASLARKNRDGDSDNPPRGRGSVNSHSGIALTDRQNTTRCRHTLFS